MPTQQPLHKKVISPLRCDVVDAVTLLPHMYFDADPVTTFALGAFSQGKAIRQAHRFVWEERFSKQLPFFEAQEISSLEVIYGGFFFGHWGHFLTETLQRLWYTQHKKLPIVWLNSPIFSEQHRAVFAGLGIHCKHILLTKPTLFAKVHFPEPGFGLMHYAHPEHMRFLGFQEGRICQERYVYISRSRYGNCTNEKALEEMLIALGWEIVFPEELSLAEQLHVFTTAKVCLMISGSAQHSLLLTKNTATRFIIIPRVHSITYELIAHFTAKEYYLFHVEQQISNAGMGRNKNKFALNIEFIESIAKATHNFTVHLEHFANIFTQSPSISEQYFTLPEIYSTADVTISKAEEYFFTALYFAQTERHHEAYKILLHLERENLLEFFMYDYFFIIIEKYDKKYGTKTSLRLSKEQYVLQKASKNLEQNPENGHNYIRVAQALEGMQRYDAAIATIHKALQKFPQWGLAHAALAQLYFAQGEKQHALQCAKQAFTLEPYDTKVKEVLSFCLRAQ